MTADSVISMGARWTVITGDNAEALPSIPDCSVDAIVTDPPAGIAFMGKEWDHHKGGRDAWIAWLRGVMAECLRVLKPGGHALIWAIPRTSHWTMTAVEDAGFEIRDCVYHAFGQGFPKSARVNRDARFCQCAASVRSGGSIGHGQRPASRTDTAAGEPDDGPPLPGAHHSTGRSRDSRAGCRPGCGSRGEPARRHEVDGQASPQSPGCAQAHTHSHEPGGERGGAPSRSPCQARRTSHPSSPDSGDQRSGATSPQTGTEESSKRWRETHSGTWSLGHSNGNTDAFPSASYNDGNGFMYCQHCGKPSAEGWGTALKPAVEPWILARKPLDGTVASNVLKHGTGALNIDGCRVGTSKDVPASLPKDVPAQLCKGAERNRSPDASGFNPNIGRFPAHLTLSHNPDCREVGTRSVRRDLVESKSDASVNAFGEGLNGSRSIGSINETIPAWECSEGCAVAMLDAQSGDVGQLGPAVLSHYATMGYGGSSTGSARPARTDSGGASRFFAVFDGREDGSSTTINACGNANTGAASTSAGRSTASSEGNSRTGGFGSMSGAPFPLDGTSTTETETRSITGSRTSSACPPNSIETTTDESERTTSSPTELSADDASGARNTGRSNRSRTEQRERSKGTASNASETHCGSGGRRTASVITPTCGNTEGVERPSSRFFYTAKASRSDREEGLAGMPTGQRDETCDPMRQARTTRATEAGRRARTFTLRSSPPTSCAGSCG